MVLRQTALARGEVRITVTSPDGWAEYGAMHLVSRGRKYLEIKSVLVSALLRRCGVGTRLYEAAAVLACDKRRVLRSDSRRTMYSQAFWEKQVRHGRAVCESPQPTPPHSDPRWPTIRGGCLQYVLTAPCPAPKLDGRRRR
jgi:GNAT superfamily N-acetyltransferase